MPGSEILLCIIKFVYSEKATKFCEIFTLHLSYAVPVKSKMKILQNFLAFSEYMHSKTTWHELRKKKERCVTMHEVPWESWQKMHTTKECSKNCLILQCCLYYILGTYDSQFSNSELLFVGLWVRTKNKNMIVSLRGEKKIHIRKFEVGDLTTSLDSKYIG